MKTTPDSEDPVLKALAAEADSLWRNAAARARARRRARATRARSLFLLLVLLTGAVIWKLSHPAPSGSSLVDARNSRTPAPMSESPGYVKLYSADDPPQTLELPPGATKREQQILEALPEIPLLICRNAAGEVVQIHVFDR